MSFPGRPTIYNVPMASASTEYSQQLPEVTQKLMVRCRQAYDLQMSWTPGTTATSYVTIPAGATYWDDSVSTSGTVYFQSKSGGAVAEIQVWGGN